MTRRIFCRGSLFVVLMLGCLGVISPGRAADPGDQVEKQELDPFDQNLEVVGRLKANSQPGSSAPYILVDKWGVVLFQVQPPAGMKLDRYLNHNIRLRGKEIESADARTPILEIQGFDQPEPAAPPPDARPGKRAPRDVTPASHTEPAGENTAGNVSLDAAIDAALSPTGRAQLASYEQGEPVSAPAPDGIGEPDGENFIGQEDCPVCGGCGCPACCNPCGPRGRYWVRAEYLYWWTEGMRIPPLVTTGPSATQPGYLDTAGTTVLFGGDLVNGFGRSGVRLTLGAWLNPCQTVGIEGEYFVLARASTDFSASSDGTPILSRPFYDLSPTAADPSQIVGQNIEEIASPGKIEGSVSVATQTELQSAGVHMLINLCCCDQCYSNACRPSLNGPGGSRIDFLIGYRYLQLRDAVGINENLTSLDPDNPGSFLVNDSFTTQNTFNGAELGGVIKKYRGRWSLDFLGKIALGNNYEIANVNGSTVTTQNGTSTTSPGGLLALSSNIGRYTRDEFAMVPELGATLGYQVTPHLRASLGYTFLYWSQVARAGDQIDLDVNSRLLPNDSRPLAGDTQHPQFVFTDTAFWAQGISAGLELRW